VPAVLKRACGRFDAVNLSADDTTAVERPNATMESHTFAEIATTTANMYNDIIKWRFARTNLAKLI
jgi:hypothetical protein